MKIRAIAFYLPPVGASRRNHTWWGQTFLARCHASRGSPLYPGHYQPRLPQAGFYDLDFPQVLKAQAALAEAFGLSGFCYYYQGSAKRPLYDPVQAMLDSTGPDFPFCICWTNESSAMSSGNSDLVPLIRPSPCAEDRLAFLENIIPLLNDPRYIRVEGKPLLLIRYAQALGDCKRVTNEWRSRARMTGLDNLFLVKCEQAGMPITESPEIDGFDAVYEFPPDQGLSDLFHVDAVHEEAEGPLVLDYLSEARTRVQRKWPSHTLFRGVIPHWDNTPCRGRQGVVFDNFESETYEWWLAEICIQTIEHYHSEKRIVFINSWNDWAHGAYLEPCLRYGRLNLQATKRALISSGICARLTETQATYDDDAASCQLAPDVCRYFRNQRNALTTLSRLVLRDDMTGDIVERYDYGKCWHCRLRHEFHRPSYRFFRNRILPLVERVPRRDLIHQKFEEIRPSSSMDEKEAKPKVTPSVIFVSHDDQLSGAAAILYSLLQWLLENSQLEAIVLIRSSRGPGQSPFRNICPTLLLTGEFPTDVAALRAFADLEHVKLIYANTATCGDTLDFLSDVNVPVISHIHELEHSIQRWAGGGLFDRVKARTDHFIAASEAVRGNLVEKHEIPYERISVIHEFVSDNGQSDEGILSIRFRIREELGIPGSSFVVGGCGTLDWRKGSDLFILLAKKVIGSLRDDDCYFVWLGGDRDSLEEKAVRLDLAHMGLERRTLFVGSKTEARDYFSAFDVFALTSREDPFPLVCLESLSVGIPVVCFEGGGGAPELIDQGCGFAVPYADIDAMAEKVLRLWTDPAERRRLGRRGRSLVESEYTVAKKGEAVKDIIMRFMNPP